MTATNGSAPAALVVEGLGVSYATPHGAGGGVPVVRDVSFSLRAGRVLGLVGESGSGKSTAALAAIGWTDRVLHRTAGTSVLGGTDLCALAPDALRRQWGRHIGYLPQEIGGALHPTFRIGSQFRETLRANCRLRRAAADQRAVELLEAVDLPEPRAILRRHPHQLSGGQLQRVALALALATRPEVLILDEPTTGLDVSSQQRVVAVLRRLVDEGSVAVLFITHDVALLSDLADDLAVMYAGEIVESGPAHEVVAAPHHPYTRALLDAVPSPAEAVTTRGIPGLPPGRVVDDQCAFADRCPHTTDACRAAIPPLVPVALARTQGEQPEHGDDVLPADSHHAGHRRDDGIDARGSGGPRPTPIAVAPNCEDGQVVATKGAGGELSALVAEQVEGRGGAWLGQSDVGQQARHGDVGDGPVGQQSVLAPVGPTGGATTDQAEAPEVAGAGDRPRRAEAVGTGAGAAAGGWLVRCVRSGELSLVSQAGIRREHEDARATVLLDVRGVTCAYGVGGRPRTVVSDVSLEVAEGRVTALVGESGSGKSTIGRTIAGLLRPVAGELSLGGEALPTDPRRRTRQQRHDIQLVLQNPGTALNPRRTAGDLLTHVASRFVAGDRAARAAAVDEVLDAVQLGPAVLGRYPSQLSGGQRQRVAIAAAFVARPRLVVCDEITSGQDVSVQAAILATLADLQQRSGTAVLFISHDLGVVRSIADHVYVLQRGSIVESGPTESLFGSPAHAYTRSLLDAVPAVHRPRPAEHRQPEGSSTP